MSWNPALAVVMSSTTPDPLGRRRWRAHVSDGSHLPPLRLGSVCVRWWEPQPGARCYARAGSKGWRLGGEAVPGLSVICILAGALGARELDDGDLLTASVSIIEWLEDSHPDPRLALLPGNPRQERACASWCSLSTPGFIRCRTRSSAEPSRTMRPHNIAGALAGFSAACRRTRLSCASPPRALVLVTRSPWQTYTWCRRRSVLVASAQTFAPFPADATPVAQPLAARSDPGESLSLRQCVTAFSSSS
jgi:hypothetical protein